MSQYSSTLQVTSKAFTIQFNSKAPQEHANITCTMVCARAEKGYTYKCTCTYSSTRVRTRPYSEYVLKYVYVRVRTLCQLKRTKTTAACTVLTRIRCPLFLRTRAPAGRQAGSIPHPIQNNHTFATTQPSARSQHHAHPSTARTPP